MLTIKIDTKNDWFVEDGLIPGLNILLREIMEKLESGKKQGVIYDINGNMVGGFKLGGKKWKKEVRHIINFLMQNPV